MNPKKAVKITKIILDTNHPLLDFRSEEAQKKVDWIYKYLKPYIFKKCYLIDLGCGGGKQSFAAERIGAKVVGIDCSKDAIKFADRVKKELKSDCRFVISDYTKTPFQNNIFDIAIFPKNIIECSYGEMDELAREVKRILKNGGKFIMTMEDGVENIVRKNNLNFKDFNLKSGMIKEKISVPGKKECLYPIYFWTVAFTKNIIFRYLKLEKELKLKNGFYLLIFRK